MSKKALSLFQDDGTPEKLGGSPGVKSRDKKLRKSRNAEYITIGIWQEPIFLITACLIKYFQQNLHFAMRNLILDHQTYCSLLLSTRIDKSRLSKI